MWVISVVFRDCKYDTVVIIFYLLFISSFFEKKEVKKPVSCNA